MPCGIDVAGRYVCNMIHQKQFNRPAVEDRTNVDNHSQLGTITLSVSDHHSNYSSGDSDLLIQDVADKWKQSFARVFELSLSDSEDPAQELDLLLNGYPHIRDTTLEKLS